MLWQVINFESVEGWGNILHSEYNTYDNIAACEYK